MPLNYMLMIRQREPIVALATPYGESAIGVLRLSGKGVLEKIKPFLKLKGAVKPRYAHLVTLVDEEGREIDEGILVFYPSPKSYTGEDMIELSLHGNPLILHRALELFLSAGIRLAEPGEFTRRAFLNGKMDLLQAEAVADLIGARTELAVRCALRQLRGELSDRIERIRSQLLELIAYVEADIEFSEQDIPTLSREEILKRLEDLIKDLEDLLATARVGNFLRKGLNLAIVGKPNVGKSSLFNALLGSQRAIVTDIPGTTRDFLQEQWNIGGIPINLVDTAGIRTTTDPVEQMGVQRSIEKLGSAHIVLLVVDGSKPLEEEDLSIYSMVKDKDHIVVLNKKDLGVCEDTAKAFPEFVMVSAKTGDGLEDLRKEILRRAGFYTAEGGSIYVSARHANLLQNSLSVIKLVYQQLREQDISPEILMLYLREAVHYLEEVIGTVTTEDVLDSIFSSFCIGK